MYGDAMRGQSKLLDYLQEASGAIVSCSNIEEQIEAALALCIAGLHKGSTIFWCGNGGSASDALHLSAELVGRFAFDRAPLPSIALNSNISTITALANDYGYEHVFARQVEALGKAGDICIGISTSGKSLSIVAALRVARAHGLKTIAFTGSQSCPLWTEADVVISVPSSVTCHIQECHIAVGQYICREIEQHFFGEQ
jgi:D-sedoheptulose 7-phosphate isomerase